MSRMRFGGGLSAWRLGDIDVSQKEKASQIADRIREAVADGAWRQGQELPGIGEIARRYGVSAITVRSALLALAEEGLVRRAETTHGYFVRGGS